MRRRSTSRSNGPTARVKEYAASQPGCLISWAEAQAAYATGMVKSWTGNMTGGASQHKMSISNVLWRHFTRVEGARGLYVLTSSIENHDREDDELELAAFHAIHGCDEFGMSLPPDVNASRRRIDRQAAAHGLFRMSEISGMIE